MMKKTVTSFLAVGGVVVLSGCGGGSSTNMAEALEELPAVEDRYVVFTDMEWFRELSDEDFVGRAPISRAIPVPPMMSSFRSSWTAWGM